MKPCGFSVNTGSKQSELQTVDFVAVVAVLFIILNAGGDGDAVVVVVVAVASVVLLFLMLPFQVAFIILHIPLSNQKEHKAAAYDEKTRIKNE